MKLATNTFALQVLYSKIAIALWRSSRGLTPHVAQHHQHQQPQQASCQDGGMGMGMHNSMYHHHQHHHHQMHHQLPSAASAATSAGSAPQAGGGVGVGVGGGPGSSLASAGSSTTSLSRKQSSKYEKRGVSITESQVSCHEKKASQKYTINKTKRYSRVPRLSDTCYSVLNFK